MDPWVIFYNAVTWNDSVTESESLGWGNQVTMLWNWLLLTKGALGLPGTNELLLLSVITVITWSVLQLFYKLLRRFLMWSIC